MALYRKVMKVKTKGEGDITNLSSWIKDCLTSSAMDQGIACVFAQHSTAAVAIIEGEPGLEGDLRRALERLVPKQADYAHNAAEGDGNGHSHIRSTFLGQSVSFPFDQGKADLGIWQQVVLIELDNHGRERTVLIQLVGE